LSEDLIVGFVAAVFGLYTLAMRLSRPERFSRLAVMKERLGERAGSLVHLVIYSLLPLAIGVYFLLVGFQILPTQRGG
jgi:TRAP-type mannitol/chloroaromatic compound transport system permease large subunit